jgi:5-(carboxyamino)imidazole ribonucleotide synthase
MNLHTPLPRLGIIGGGQLGKMLCQAASELGVKTTVLDPDPHAPASSVSSHHIVASFDDASAYEALVKHADVITYEREDLDDGLLNFLKENGLKVFPDPKILNVIQDKAKQKQFFVDHNIPTSRFVVCDQPNEDEFNAFGYPLVQKARCGGFDGRGVSVMKDGFDAQKVLPVPSILEECVAIETELAIMVARAEDGHCVAYPTVEMTMDSENNILDTLTVPAALPDEEHKKIEALGCSIAAALDLVGVLSVELFKDNQGDIWVNEVSSRTHNSGHYTIEACVTSQFHQHLRAILGLPLGSVELLSSATMVNILGSGTAGKTHIHGLERVLSLPGVSVHLYGKAHVSPGRKMGHSTILASDLEEAKRIAKQVKEQLRVSGE